jgi:hypothetical protein
MSYKVFPLILLLFLNGCAHFQRPKPAPRTTSPVVKKPTQRKVVPFKAKPAGEKKTLAVFHLVSPQTVELSLESVEGDRSEKILVDKTLSQVEIEPGEWRVMAITSGDKTYQTLNPVQAFTFRIQAHDANYVGSYILQCPRVGSEHLGQMKQMSFFNRYVYGQEAGLCEMVVGNDFQKVQRAWLKINKKNHSLKLGF